MYEKKNDSSAYITSDTCPICGKRFVPAPYHRYKIYVDYPYRGIRLVCSYSCMNKGKAAHEALLKQKCRIK